MAFTKPNVNIVWASEGTSISPGSAKITLGWVTEIPDYEFENWIQNRQDQFIAHVNQYGIAVWDSATEYQAGKSYVQGSDGVIYKAVTTNTNQNPTTTTPTHWVVAFDNAGTSYTKAEADSRNLLKANNLSDLTNVATARTNLVVYSKSEADSRYLLESNNLSDLVNASTARNNLGVYGTTEVYNKTEGDARYLLKSNNLSGLTNVATARTNLVVYSKSEADSRYLLEANNLSDLVDAAAARSNLNLGTAATKDVGTGASNVLQTSDADARYTSIATGDARWLNEDNNLSDLTNTTTARSNLGVPYVFNNSLNGYYTLPGGMIVQWGFVNHGANDLVNVTFPIAFPNACHSIVATQANYQVVNANITVDSIGLTQFRIFNDANSVDRWIAIGY